jgi:hypothetical protein
VPAQADIATVPPAAMASKMSCCSGVGTSPVITVSLGYAPRAAVA